MSKNVVDELKDEFKFTLVDDLATCEGHLMDFEQSHDSGLLAEVNRILHSLKGSAQALDLKLHSQKIHDVESFIKSFENQTAEVQGFVSTVLQRFDEVRSLPIT